MPVPGQLSTDKTNGYGAFQTVGLDYAGPILYKEKTKNLKKAYILLITCSLSRAVHLELVQSQKLEEFIICFKRFVARRGRPQKSEMKSESERFQDYLSESCIKWQFSLSRAP